MITTGRKNLDKFVKWYYMTYTATNRKHHEEERLMTRRDLYFAVEGGATLELARKHVAERAAVEEVNRALAKELGAERYAVDYATGVLCGVIFPGKPHSDFKKPNKNGVSTPRARTAWGARLASMKGYDRRGFSLAKALGVPTDISYRKDGTVRGAGCISDGFSSGVGLLYLSEDGPFALYIPDIAQVVADYEARGYTVCDECKNFKPDFDGARQILKEEWELTVARHKLAEAEKKVAA